MLARFRQSFDQLPPARRLQLAAVVVGTVVALLAVGRWASQPDYALLFGSLPAADAGRIVEQLDAQGVTYDLRDGGTAVYVPSDEVYGLRLRMATEGLVSDGPAGYELFDGGTLGMTDFMQRLNMKRALEGELARTIGAIRQVRRARVHLVLPERSPFRDRQAAASASVVLGVGGTLAPDQVAGIAALVAGAVEGMSPAEVTVLDEAGRMLTGPGASGADAGLSTTQVRMRQEVEGHLAEAGQSMLDRMLGPGRAVVRVAADLDLSRTSTETQEVDPESQTVLSEETQAETGQGVGAESSVRNFEVSRTTTRSEREAGTIRTLTVSVLLDEAAPAPELARPPEGGEATPTPFTDDQLRQIESLVKNAVGFDDERGDRFAVQQIRFSAPPEAEASLFANVDASVYIGLALRYGVMILVLLLGYRLLRRLADGALAPADADAARGDLSDTPQLAPAAAPALAGAPGQPQLAVGADGQLLGLSEAGARATIEAVEGDPYAAKLSPEARRLAEASELVESLRASVAADAPAAAATVRTWLREPVGA
ncbi:flagellar basal-body MS-ring/collar protein FliF [Rubrivirga sp. IMCC43871]|uniref:flagellar basal-body MS-ring/collar protein FliF n=1 Tax=Rubrivirga sp. IMCC43871 TaxID=3391575 RepID=UPI00398FFACB